MHFYMTEIINHCNIAAIFFKKIHQEHIKYKLHLTEGITSGQIISV